MGATQSKSSGSVTACPCGKPGVVTTQPRLPNGTPFPISECGIVQSIRIGIGRYADDEVFWRSDGTRFFAEYHAHPQMRDGVVIGALVCFGLRYMGIRRGWRLPVAGPRE